MPRKFNRHVARWGGSCPWLSAAWSPALASSRAGQSLGVARGTGNYLRQKLRALLPRPPVMSRVGAILLDFVLPGRSHVLAGRDVGHERRARGVLEDDGAAPPVELAQRNTERLT